MAQVRLTAEFMHPPELVWRAITDARLLSDWFMPTDLAPETGHRFRLDPGTLPGFLGPVEGEVAEVVPLLRLVTLWRGDKLHTRTVWELSDWHGRGCRLRVAQSGFLGAPARLRSEALFDTYVRLFAVRLPVTLARLAAGGPGDGGAGGERDGLWVRPAVPPGALERVDPAAGGAVTGPARAGTAPAQAPAYAPGGAAVPDADPRTAGEHVEDARTAAARPATNPPVGASQLGVQPVRACDTQELAPVPVSAAESSRARGTWRPWWWRRAGRSSTVVGAFARNLLVGAGAAVFAAAVVTGVTYVSAEGPGGGLSPEERTPPGVAMQPGRSSSPADHASGGATSDDPPREAGAGAPADEVAGSSPGSSGVTTASPGSGEHAGSPETSGSPRSPGSSAAGTPPGSEAPPTGTGPPVGNTLSAEYTVDAPLFGDRTVEVTVRNHGPAAVEEWEVSFDVHDQEVIQVTDAEYADEDGDAVFTPDADELAAGEQATFSFQLRPPTLGLLGGEDPTGCTIDDEPCD